MDEQLTLFDIMEDGEKYKPIKSTDWKWQFSDYPTRKNGLKVFSCFACGGAAQWDINLQDAKSWGVARLTSA